MEDWQAAVYKALSAISGAEAHFYYPQKWPAEDVTVITYRQGNQVAVSHADDDDYITETEIIVDEWNRDPAIVHAKAKEVKAALKPLGFERVYSTDIYEQETGLHHRNERYRQYD